MWHNKTISVVFPAYNEEENIERAIKDFFSTGIVDEIIVVDNNSKDKTASMAKKSRAKCILEKKQGYGHALQRGLREAAGDIIVTTEPDGTFLGRDLFKLLAYTEDFDVVFGTRTSKECIWDGANMNWFLRIGNWTVAKLLEYCFNGPSLTDIGCTYKLIKKEALKKIQKKFTVGGSHFSPEFMILCLKGGLKTVEIPVNYKKRIGTSKITGKTGKAFKLGLIMIGLILAYKFHIKG